MWQNRTHRADNDRRSERKHGGEQEDSYSAKRQTGSYLVIHDPLDSFSDIGAADSRHAGKRRFDVPFAHDQDSLRVCLWFSKETQHFFIASALPLIDQPGADPPDERMKPEERLHEHMYGGGDIVATPGVTHFMSNDSLKL